MRNRGATSECEHSCTTVEYKRPITEICSPRPPCNENRAVVLLSAALQLYLNIIVNKKYYLLLFFIIIIINIVVVVVKCFF